MPSPLDNKMLLYYMTSLGQGLMNPDDPMQQVAGVTKQQITAENQMKLIQKFLSGGGALKQKDGKLNYTGDISSFLSGGGEGGGTEQAPFAGSPPGTAANAPGGIQESKDKMTTQSFLNPSPSPTDISGADLVGLTPENITQALQLKFTSEELERKKLSDLMSMVTSAGAAAPIETPGIGKLSLKQWSSLPTEDRSYFLYAASAKQRDEEVMSKKDWEASTDENTRIQYLKELEKDPKLKSLAIELAQAGATKIGDIAGRQVEVGIGKGQSDVMSPGYAQSVRDDLVKDKANWPSETLIKQYTGKGLPYTEAEERAQKRMVLETMDKQIRQAFRGKEVTLGDDGWYVDDELKVRFP